MICGRRYFFFSSSSFSLACKEATRIDGVGLVTRMQPGRAWLSPPRPPMLRWPEGGFADQRDRAGRNLWLSVAVVDMRVGWPLILVCFWAVLIGKARPEGLIMGPMWQRQVEGVSGACALQ